MITILIYATKVPLLIVLFMSNIKCDDVYRYNYERMLEDSSLINNIEEVSVENITFICEDLGLIKDVYNCNKFYYCNLELKLIENDCHDDEVYSPFDEDCVS